MYFHHPYMLWQIIDACFIMCVSVGILERQISAWGGSEEIQGKENGNISAVEKKNQEGSAKPQPADGAIAAEDSRSAQIIQT